MSEPRFAGKRVLIVEDHSELRSGIAAVVTKMGFEAVTALNVQEATTILRSQLIHVVLTDIKLPGEDGLQIVRVARSIMPGAFIIVMSGDPDATEAATELTEAKVRILDKPFGIKALTDLVSECFPSSAR